MTNRHLSRSIATQALYEIDFRGGYYAALDLKKILARLADEFASRENDLSFIRKLVFGVIEKQHELDDIIAKAAPEWPIEKIAITDRNILRIGLFELLFSNQADVPARVAINEAIELAKTFGGETSGKFVNGVLGTVYKEIEEAQKEHRGKNKENNAFVDLKNLPLEKLGGVVVYAKENGEIYLALVHDVFGRWTLSKGHFVGGEGSRDEIVRIAKKELGLRVSVEDLLGENEYIASHPEKGKIRKQVSYYLAESPFRDIVVEKTGGLDDAQWFKLSDVIDLNMYDDMLPVIAKAINILLAKNKQ